MANEVEIVDVNEASVETCGLCGANALGHQRKREWIRQCLPYGLRYRTLVERSTGRNVGMIEYMPGGYAWRAIQAPGYLVIHCLQVPKRYAGRGLGSLLVRACVEDARIQGLAGVVTLATEAGWCADRRIFLKHGFEVAGHAAPAFELLVRRLRPADPPHLGDWQRRLRELGTGVFMYSSAQCPFMRVERAVARKEWLEARYGLSAHVIDVTRHEMAQANPCAWGTSGIVCNGEIVNYVHGGDGHLLKQFRRIKAIPRKEDHGHPTA